MITAYNQDIFATKAQIEEFPRHFFGQPEFLPLYYFVATTGGFFLYEKVLEGWQIRIYATFVKATHFDVDIISFRRPGGQIQYLPVGGNVRIMTKEEFKNVKLR